jgi:hypothetical protein
MKLHLIRLFGLSLFTLILCAAFAGSGHVQADSPTPVATLTPGPTQTRTSRPSSTPTTDWLHQPTRTPQPAAKCPQKYEELKATPVYFDYQNQIKAHLDLPDDFFDVENNFISDLANFLTKYGPAPLSPYIQSRSIDLTHDGIAEVITNINTVIIFGCQDGKYIELFNDKNSSMFHPEIVNIQDANRNGIPDLLYITGFDNGGGRSYTILEWDGHTFQNLEGSIYPSMPDIKIINVERDGKARFEDVDRDGLKEFIVDSGIPNWPDFGAYAPMRSIRRIFHWDGQLYNLKTEDYDPPQYRFQAVQDGDRKSLSKEYDRALALYQEAIFSDKLEWWSAEREHFYQNVLWSVEDQAYYLHLWELSYSKVPTPIPPQPDPDEYPNLAAYARYRIMLLHIVQGHPSDAKTVYDTLQKKFPQGSAGSMYAALAKTFWETYQTSQNIGTSCAQAIHYARQNSAILRKYIGDNLDDAGDLFHGLQSIQYKAEDICPFK